MDIGAHGMAQAAGSSGTSGRSRSRYRPPAGWQTVPFHELLSGSPRGLLETKQLDWLNSVNKSRDAEGASTVFAAGDLSLTKRRCIAVIGTRDVSEGGRKRATRLARELVEQDVVVVSGLAAGVDYAALASAIRAGGRVIAVIGTPLDQAYPAANADLQEDIYENHLLISQFEQGSRVFRSNFPARNRTMAALSDASVVIEASDSSGTLHQAAECVRLGRWLGIAKSVVDDPSLTWPRKFLGYSKCLVLEDTAELLAKVYGD